MTASWLLTMSTLCGWCIYISSVQFSRSVVSDSLRPHELQNSRPPCPSQTPGVYSNSCSSSRWCHCIYIHIYIYIYIYNQIKSRFGTYLSPVSILTTQTPSHIFSGPKWTWVTRRTWYLSDLTSVFYWRDIAVGQNANIYAQM